MLRKCTFQILLLELTSLYADFLNQFDNSTLDNMAMTTMADELPDRLYRAEQVRQLDRLAIEGTGVSGFELMQRAGRALFRQILRRWPKLRAMTLFCGGGNNGGDGYVVAGLARERGIQAQLYYLADPAGLKHEAAEARDWASARGVTFEAWAPGAPMAGEILVDALLGTGLTSEIRAPYREAIAAINRAGRPVVAVDVPSGLCSDTGIPLGEAVRATLTWTFVGLKPGLLTGLGPDYCGELGFDGLGVDAADYPQVPLAARRLDWRNLKDRIPPRRPCAHKGEFGRVLILGGDEGMGGAAILAAEAAARAGAGLLHVATRQVHVPAFLSRCPEAMVKGIHSREALLPMLARADVVVVGPGLGTGAWSQQLLQAALESGKPLVLDADALNLMAAQGLAGRVRGVPHVITPHPGEAARLLGCQVADVQADRFQAVARLQRLTGGAVLLKGAGTLVAGPEEADCPSLVQAGNPGMATGGMGDLLSGVIGALLAQGHAPREAAELGAALHGACADLAARELGYISLLPRDLLAAMPLLLRQCDPRSRGPEER